MKKKLLYFVIVALLLVSVFLWKQLENAHQVISTYQSKESDAFLNTLWNFHNDLFLVSENLSMYNDDFTEREQLLFQESVDKAARTLHRLEMYLFHNSNFEIIYSRTLNLPKISKTLQDISSGDINDEKSIQAIATILLEGEDSLSIITENDVRVESFNEKNFSRYIDEYEKITNKISVFSQYVRKPTHVN
ncbi:hypothetical protein [Bacillus alkalicellulosilyticus]|uniref:hypothetical protein n=1 Tax=Alkalihalobacterium alkalicellulosilyticum TaxID=1912214 RepID=UPI00099633E2|nr:hypothetical protein [Bacillus alkalicellulosilyticus]